MAPPTKHPDRKRIATYFSGDEYAKLARVAKSLGISLSQLVGDSALQALAMPRAVGRGEGA